MGCLGRFTLLLSIVLMIASAVVMIIGLQGTDNATVKNILETLYCEENEQAVHELGAYQYSGANRQGGRPVWVYCEDTTGEGTRREITGQATLLLIGSFATPFVFGLLLFIGSIGAIVRRKTQSFVGNITSLSQLSQQGSVIDMRGGQQVSEIPPEALETIQQVFGKIGSVVQSTIPKQDLSERLKQLREAYDEGLISRNEYERVRDAILDNFDD